jgi:eukaryotic-like serine/threonine-protein kinase
MPYAPDLSGHALDDRYELHALIGEGAFGRVYQGRDRRLARPVAVKVIKPWWTEDPDWVASFEREAQLLARVSDPGIVQIFDVGHAPEGLYYVSELVDGENLASRLHRGALPPWQACGIAAQLCRGLAHAHAQRIVHRDVKPANILLSSRGRVKVGDFGVARLAEGTTDGAAATVVGTPKYMAPEQGRGRPTTPATDVYSVGVVLYEMLSGKPPFNEDSVVAMAVRHLQDPPPPLPGGVPAPLAAIVGRALAKDPARRYADGAEMADALVDARRSASDRQRTRAPRSRSRVASHAPGPAGAPAGTRALVAPGGTATAVSTPAPVRRAAGLDDAPAGAPARTRDPGPPTPDATRPAPPAFPRRNVNPAARRRAIAALALAFALLTVMVAGAILLAGPVRTRVPKLTGLSRAAARARAHRGHLHALFATRYDAAPAGTVVAQHPGAGVVVKDGSTVSATVSRGLAPVPVPLVVQEASSEAQATMQGSGLKTAITYVAAPGITPGTVTRTFPRAGVSAPAHSTVTLFEAETPRWRPLTSFSGGRSTVFSIRGRQWRIVYTMAFHGTCTWIFFCSGPSAQVVNAATGSTVDSFGLNDGATRTTTVSSGPGEYEIRVKPGGDEARWSLQVEDYY